jgi:hypothetical protein
MSAFNVIAKNNPKVLSSFNVEDENMPDGFFSENYVSVSFLVNNETIIQAIIINVITYLVLSSFVYMYLKNKKEKITEKKLGCVSKKIVAKKE